MDPLPPFPFRVAVVGAGRVGTAVASLLKRAGHEVTGVASRSRASARAAADRLGVDDFEIAAGLPESTDVVLVGAPDGALEEVAGALASSIRPGTVVCHFAGALGPSALGPAMDAGARAAATHPVQACPDVDAGIARIPNSAWGVTCSDDATTAWARAWIARDLRGDPVTVTETHRPLWHAASVTTSNGIAALLASGEAILRSIGVERPEVVLGPLAAGTVQNARDGSGGGLTLTGPIVRREAATLERHVQGFLRDAPELLDLYRHVARLIVDAAVAAGRIDLVDRESLMDLLE